MSISVFLQYFKTIYTRLTITYLETWNGRNRINLDKKPAIHSALISFYESVGRSSLPNSKDTAQLLT